jgi:hypothetical protein
MKRQTKLKIAILWFAASAVIFMAGYAQGTYDMMATVKELIK